MRTAILAVRFTGLALLLAVVGCRWNPPARAVAPNASACGDPCAAMSCPAAFHCTWNPQCQARCEPNPIRP